jgi:hypothetical protein
VAGPDKKAEHDAHMSERDFCGETAALDGAAAGQAQGRDSRTGA